MRGRHGDVAGRQAVELEAAVGVRGRRAPGAASHHSPHRRAHRAAFALGRVPRHGGVGHGGAARVEHPPGQSAASLQLEEDAFLRFPFADLDAGGLGGAVTRGRPAHGPLPGWDLRQLEAPIVGLKDLVAAAAADHDLHGPAAARPRAPNREIGDGLLRVRVLDPAADRPRRLQHDRDIGGRRRDVLLLGRVTLRRHVQHDRPVGREAFQTELPIRVRRAVLRPPAAAHVDGEDLGPGDRAPRGVLDEAPDRRAGGERHERPDVFARGLDLDGGNGLAREALLDDGERVLPLLEPFQGESAVFPGVRVGLVALEAHHPHLDARAAGHPVLAVHGADLRAGDRLLLSVHDLAARLEAAPHDERHVLDRVAGPERDARLARRRIAGPRGFQ